MLLGVLFFRRVRVPEATEGFEGLTGLDWVGRGLDEDLTGIGRGFDEDSTRIRRGFDEDSRRIRRGFDEDSARIRLLDWIALGWTGLDWLSAGGAEATEGFEGS